MNYNIIATYSIGNVAFGADVVTEMNAIVEDHTSNLALDFKNYSNADGEKFCAVANGTGYNIPNDMGSFTSPVYGSGFYSFNDSWDGREPINDEDQVVAWTVDLGRIYRIYNITIILAPGTTLFRLS